MANEAQIFIKGNFLIAKDITTREQFFRVPRDQVKHNRDGTDIFTFMYNAPITNLGTNQDFALQGAKDGVGRTVFPFADILDVSGVPYADADTFDDFLCTNLGSLTPAVLPIPPTGIQSFFLVPRGSFGTGGGWADEGFIGDVPVLLFDRNVQEKEVTTFYTLARVVLTNIDPVVSFLTYSTSLPVLTTGDGVRWQLEARYIADGEAATKAVDETIFETQILTNLAVDTRQPIVSFTLDRTLITDQDAIILTLSRVAGDAADNYNADLGAGQAGIILEVTPFNP